MFTLSGNDLDSIRALFSEKEKELSLAVAKVEALTRQLEELRRDRRGLSLITNNGNNQQPPSQAARELEKLRRELMVSTKVRLMVVINQAVVLSVCEWTLSILIYDDIWIVSITKHYANRYKIMARYQSLLFAGRRAIHSIRPLHYDIYGKPVI